MQKERTHTCGQLRKSDVGKTVILQGWVNRRRDHGGVTFIDLRDRYGLTQVVVRTEATVRNEYVIEVTGKVTERPSGMINAKLPTGEVEVTATDLTVLSESKTPPFTIDEETDASEGTRLKYRYLDLRRSTLQKNLLVRAETVKAIRRYMDSQNFVDIETPYLTKSTPEGARDYLVPSRLQHGNFFALPQSPQLFKQLLMMSGFDRYYQIVRCFRDEDLRADRQPEFTQLDIEMSFPTMKTIYTLLEGLMAEVFEKVLGEKIQTPFIHLPYDEAISKYASDKPDLRWDIQLNDLTSGLKNTKFRVFQEVISKGGEVRGFRLPKGADLPRSQLDQLTESIKEFGAKGLVWIKEAAAGRTSSVDKFLTPEETASISKGLELQPGDLGLLVADQLAVTRASLSALRRFCVEKMKIPPTKKYAFLWVDSFPLFDYDPLEKRYVSMHHPFTAPHPEDLKKVNEKKDLTKVRAQAYDLVLNGYEIGGGSIRIHRTDLQQRIFDCLGLSKEDAKQKFGFFLDALEYGTPPHGGIALGVDRLAMVMVGTDAIRDVIAFPKTQSAVDLMCEAPSPADPKQLLDLGLKKIK